MLFILRFQDMKRVWNPFQSTAAKNPPIDLNGVDYRPFKALKVPWVPHNEISVNIKTHA